MSDISITCVQGRSGLASIKDEWNTVTKAMERKHYFHLHEWHHSYINSFEQDDASVHFFLFHENNRPIAIFPLALREIKVFGIGIPVFKMYPDGSLFGSISDCIVSEKNRHLLNLLFGYLRNSGISWYVMIAAKSLEDSCIISQTCSDYRINSVRKFNGQNDYLTKEHLDRTKEDMESNRQKMSNRNLRRLGRMGTVDVKNSATTHDTRRYFDEFLAIEASGWKGSNGNPINSDPKHLDFFYQVIENFSQIRACEMNMLYLDDRSIAGLFALMVDDIYYPVKIGYDESYAKMSPGVVLMEQMFGRLSTEGVVRECNCISHSNWMTRWSPYTNKTYQVLIFNPSLVGQLCSRGYSIASKIRHVRASEQW